MVHQRTAMRTETQVDGRAFVNSDDECVQKLAALIEHRDSRNLSEIASLIGRLAVPVV